ncbi:hypothetical protein H257_10644 [Aphanomyces astaci]|uniref:Uncharacterized protein n=1 Tax=Aphanomyces astaci TaxID=112090 RepID=W4G711_APHAT|nr:hypothetical protein H257_10644 [Aphanomyces astaci]ETV75046.1 hypothetical protein H257_10644 [Aphanomyces astaci]|eukprot:XP_009835550.1 hypothetical protein H257_10644 [Aphanomyces astaci]
MQGRRTIASTMILSQIWHITASNHRRPLVSPPPASYVASRQAHRTRHPPHCVHNSQPTVATPAAINVLTCLRFPSALGVFGPATVVQCLQQLYRTSHPFDFLWQCPHSLSAWMYTTELHPLWLDVWFEWSRVPLERRISIAPDIATTLDLPLWDSTFAPFLDIHKNNAARMSSKRAPTGSWCLHGASNGLRSLRDFLRVGVGGSWPSFHQFIAAMSSGNRAVPVVLQNGSIRFAPVEKSRLIYEHFTKILRDVKLLYSIPHDAQLQMLPLTDHTFQPKIKYIVVPFEVWPK